MANLPAATSDTGRVALAHYLFAARCECTLPRSVALAVRITFITSSTLQGRIMIRVAYILVPAALLLLIAPRADAGFVTTGFTDAGGVVNAYATDQGGGFVSQSRDSETNPLTHDQFGNFESMSTVDPLSAVVANGFANSLARIEFDNFDLGGVLGPMTLHEAANARVNNEPRDASGFDAGARIEVDDTLHFTSSSTNVATVGVPFFLDGALDVQQLFQNEDLATVQFGVSAFDVGTATGRAFSFGQSAGFTFDTLNPSGPADTFGNFPIQKVGLLVLPVPLSGFVTGEWDVGIQITLQVHVGVGSDAIFFPQNATAASTFSDTAGIGFIEPLDANGNVLPSNLLTVTADSGINYLGVPTSVPEPSSLVLTVCAVALIGRVHRRRRLLPVRT